MSPDTKIVLTSRAALLPYIILIPGSGAAEVVLPRGTFPVIYTFTFVRPDKQWIYSEYTDMHILHVYAEKRLYTFEEFTVEI